MSHHNQNASHGKTLITKVPKEIMLISQGGKKPWKFVMHGLPIDNKETMARYRPAGMEVPTLIPVFVLENGRLKQVNAEFSGAYTIVE